MTQYREIPKDRILKFKATPGFKGWEHFFDRKSVVHPAKMNLNLLRWIISNYTQESDTVLDPMAGTGSTAILSSVLGRNSIALEYEPKFCKMIEENIQKTINHKILTSKGNMVCIQGDARELNKHIMKSDIIITSPPYSNLEISSQGADGGKQNWNKSYWSAKKDGDWSKFKNQMKKQKAEQGYSEEIGVIISSPPYGNRLSDVAIQDGDPARMGYRQAIDVVLTSPPYESKGLDGGDAEKRINRLKEAGYDPEKYVSGRARNTVLKPYDAVDAIVTSPPYGSDNANLQAREDKSAKSVLETTGMRAIPLKENNLGNLDGEEYLIEMSKVYSECYDILKISGIMILVVKNFIRKKQVHRLDLDTIKICEEIGFKLIDHWYFELPARSFWLNLYHAKYPDVPEVKYEDILVFERPFDIKGEIS